MKRSIETGTPERGMPVNSWARSRTNATATVWSCVAAVGLFFLAVTAQAQDGITGGTDDAAVSATAGATETTRAELRDITFNTLPGDRVQIKLNLSGNVLDPASFSVDDPARIALDLSGTKNKVPWRSKRVGLGMVKTIGVIESGGRTRVVINLVRSVGYDVKVVGTDVVVTLGAGVVESAPQALAQTPQVGRGGSGKAAGAAHMAVARTVQNIDFRRGEAGEGRIVVTFSDPAVVVDVREEGGRIRVDFIGVSLPPALRQRLDVTDFATPAKTIDTVQDGDNVKMLIAATGAYEHLAYQSDNTFTVDVKPMAKNKQADAQKDQYKGEKLSLNFQDIEVRAVLQLLADFTGLNVVVSDTVQGSITLRMKNVPWDQALDIIMKTKGLSMRQTGTVMLVAPSDELASREKQELEALKQMSELAPLRSELMQVNYAKAQKLADILKSDKNSLLSDRGNVTVDDRTNTLLIRDTVDRLAEIGKLIAKLDIPIRQVLIEARIVIATDGFSKQLGARLGFRGYQKSGKTTFMSSGNTESLGTTASVPGQNLNVNFPINSITRPASIALGMLSNNSLLDLELSALQAEGRGEVVSNPRVITSNQKEATIEQGSEIPYQQASSSGATNVSFKKAVLSLKVSPQITPDDRIILDLKVSKDSVSNTLYAGVPAIDKREVATQVLVDNGETVVLGGIYEQDKSNSTSKVPFLGDLPLIGALFRSRTEKDDKNELLIFVTPKILKEHFKLQ